MRSKRGGVHVKEIDPREIDAALATHAASWIVAEFLRLYHKSAEADVQRAMQSLMHSHIPFVETFGDEVVVTRKVTAEAELLLLLSKAEPHGLDRRALGKASKFAAPSVTRALQSLAHPDQRFVHLTSDGRYRITGSGAAHLAQTLGMVLS